MTPAEWIALGALAIPLWGMAVSMGEMKAVLERASTAIEALEARVRDIENYMPRTFRSRQR